MKKLSILLSILFLFLLPGCSDNKDSTTWIVGTSADNPPYEFMQNGEIVGFDIDFIKIDRSFISNLENEPDNLALIEAIIVMSKKLGIKTIAEGAETQYQNDVLTKSGCNYIQGYYYSKPIPVKEFDKLVTRHNEQL